ncbi:MAG: hypothetical protein KBT53_00035 [Porticoccus sp.]|nr:hypothetical protein [Porticoccus sp.]MBQ0807832.1 hypothetical protein [Porticoccus sp.]
MELRTLWITAIMFFAFTFSFQAHAYYIVDENENLYVYADNGDNVGQVSKGGNLKGFKKLIKKARKIDAESDGDKSDDK